MTHKEVYIITETENGGGYPKGIKVLGAFTNYEQAKEKLLSITKRNNGKIGAITDEYKSWSDSMSFKITEEEYEFIWSIVKIPIEPDLKDIGICTFIGAGKGT